MRNLLRSITFLGLMAACQSQDQNEFGITPVSTTYNDESAPLVKLTCQSINCENPIAQEKYTYNAEKKLIRQEQFYRDGSGQLIMYGYTELIYSPDGKLTRKTQYQKQNNTENWIPNYESEYSYNNDTEREHFYYFENSDTSKRTLSQIVESVYQNEQKISQTQMSANREIWSRSEYQYVNNTLVKEIWFDANGKETRRFQHTFTNTRRQITEFYPAIKDQISVVEKTYDAQGRILSQETKVMNALLCTFQPGIIRYVY